MVLKEFCGLTSTSGTRGPPGQDIFIKELWLQGYLRHILFSPDRSPMCSWTWQPFTESHLPKHSPVRSQAALCLSYNKQVNPSPLYLLGSTTSLNVFSWWVFLAQLLPSVFDKKKIYCDLLLCCLLANMFHASFALKFTFLFIRVFVLLLSVHVCASVSQKTFVFLNTSQMIGYLFCILPSYIISLHCFKAKRAKVTQLRIFPQTSSL